MSFSTTATEQREKEAKSVKSFLVFSLIGSLAMHIGVLASGLGNLLSVASIEEDEPIEITFVEPETQVTPTLPQERVEQSPSTPVPQSQPSIQKIEKQEVISPQKSVQEEPRKTTVSDKPVESSVSQTSQNSTPTANNNSSDEPTTSSTETGGSSGDVGVLTGSDTNSGIAFENDNDNGNGHGTGTTEGNSTVTGRRQRETVVTRSSAPTPNVPTEIERSHRDSNGSDDGRASCQECDTAYPEQARRNGVEGRVEVAVDTDAEGNVTDVRVVRSSGNSDLDEATIRQAREWKLKPSERGRQGVTIGTEYAIEGSQRHRELQESAGQSQAQQRQQTTAVQSGRNRRQMETATNNTNATTTGQPQSVATPPKKTTEPSTVTSNTATPNTSTSHQQIRHSGVTTNSSSSTPSSAPRQVQRSNAATSTTQKPAATSTTQKPAATSTTQKPAATQPQPQQQPVVSNNNTAPSTIRRRREFNRANNNSNSRQQRQLAAPKNSKN
jgi:TonB family protein